MAVWTRFQSILFGGAIGAAARTAIEPQLEPARQEAWRRNPNRVLDLARIAALQAQGLISETQAQDYAKRDGYDVDKLAAVAQLALHTPESGPLNELLNRGTINEDQFVHALAKAQIEPQYWPALLDLAADKLSAAEIANAVQQGHMPNPGILPNVSAAVEPPGGAIVPPAPDGQPPSRVPLTQINIDPLEEIKASGLDAEQLRVMANLAGLPPGPEALLAMWNRNLLDESSVDAGIREGHMKTKWGGAFKRMRWAVLSAQDYASAHLRQWVTEDEMNKGGALTGHTPEQMRLLFLNRGRPASPTQMWRAWARGAIGPRGVPTSFEDHAKAIAISDIRPEYADLLWEIRFNYPPLFQLNRLVQAGAITPAVAADWAHKSLYAPEVIQALQAYWSGGVGPTASKWLDRARSRLFTTAHDEYMDHEIDDVAAVSLLQGIGAAAAEANAVVDLWTLERGVYRRDLTEAQVLKFYKRSQWTRVEAFDWLTSHGVAETDADDLLNAV